MSKENIADFVAGEMSDILHAEEFRQVFSKPVPVKTAAKKKDEDDGDDKDKEKDEKDDKKKDKKKDKKSQLEMAIKGIAKISDILDSHGLTKSAIATIRALETIVSEAQGYGSDSVGDMSYAKDKKDDDDDKKDEDKKDDEKDEKDEKKDDDKDDKNDLDLFPGKAPGEGTGAGARETLPEHYPKTQNPDYVPGGGYSEPKGEKGPEGKTYDYDEDQNKSDVSFAKDDDKKEDDKDDKKEDKKEDKKDDDKKDDEKDDKKDDDKNDAGDLSYDKDKELEEGSEEIYELLEALGLSPDEELKE